MGIKFTCPKCGRHLNVKASLGGKRGRCPHCNDKIFIPAEDESPDGAGVGAVSPSPASASPAAPAMPGPGAATNSPAPASPAPASPAVGQLAARAPAGMADPLVEAPNSQWYVMPASGGSQYGPATGEVLRAWMQEGRVAADSLVWRQDWPDWKKAAAVFPQLGPATSASPAGMALPSAYPAAGYAPSAGAPRVIPAALPANGPMPLGAGGVPMATVASGPVASGSAAGHASPAFPVAMGASSGPSLGSRSDHTRYRRRSNTGPIVAIVVLVLAMIPLSYLVWQVLNDQLTTAPLSEPADEMDSEE